MTSTGALHDAVARHGGRIDTHEGHLRWWATDPDASLEDAAAHLGLVVTRRLHQMRRPLPVEPTLPRAATRAFDPERDVDAWLAVNNVAFAWHPDQGNWTRSDLEARMAEPWFDLEGFRVSEHDGVLDGFCWTKVHAATVEPEDGRRGTAGEAAPDAVGSEPEPEVAEAVGEIYVIAVAPARVGTGLGTALTVAGLDWLWTERHTPIGMLYVEADNTRALATYRRIGFEITSTDIAFEPA